MLGSKLIYVSKRGHWILLLLNRKRKLVTERDGVHDQLVYMWLNPKAQHPQRYFIRCQHRSESYQMFARPHRSPSNSCKTWHFWKKSVPWFNIKMSSYHYRKSHCGEKTVLRQSYLHHEIFDTGKMATLFWIRALVLLRARCGRYQ